MKGFILLVIANVKDMVRDRMSIFWFVAFPLLFILLFGTIFSNDQSNTKYSVGLAAESNGPLTENITTAFRSIPAFDLHLGARENELQALKKGKRAIVIVIPENMAFTGTDGLEKGTSNPVEVNIYYDPAKSTTAQVLISTAQEILTQTERRITGAPRLFTVKPMKIEAGKLKTIDYILPGILAMALMQLGMFGALNFVSLRERKIIRRLGATPLPRSLMLWSEVVVRLGMALFQTFTIIIIGNLVFKVTITGSPFLILGTVILGAIVFISLGYLLVTFAKTEESAQGVIQLVQFPMMFLSGIFFPVEIMPAFLKPVISALPLTYLGDVLRYVMVGLPSTYGMLTDLTVLSCWLIVTLVLAIKLFKWE